MAATSKKKCRQHSTEHLSYGLIPSTHNEMKAKCLICTLLLYIMLYIMLAYLMLFASLFNAVCLHDAYFCY